MTSSPPPASRRTRTFLAALGMAGILGGLWLASPSGPTCDAASGEWEVVEASCGDHDVLGAGGLAASYDLAGARSQTTWTLPGCRVEVDMDVESHASVLRFDEHAHACAATAGPVQMMPCCQSGPADLQLAFGCRAAADEMVWTARLGAAGVPVGPWADRGPWRGCRVGETARVVLARTAHAGAASR